MRLAKLGWWSRGREGGREGGKFAFFLIFYVY